MLTDIDGTLVQPSYHEISSVVLGSIRAVESQGVRVTPVTGRPYGMVEEVLQKLGSKDLAVVDGGATIRRAQTGEMVWSKWLDQNTARKIADILMPHSVAIHYSPVFNLRDVDDIDLDSISGPLPFVFSFFHADRKEEIKESFAEIPGIAAHFCKGRKEYPDCLDVHVSHIEADKFHGVKALRQIIDITPETTLAIGDDNNDLPLFACAGIKVAMGNATDELKAAADYVVAPVSQDGFAEAMDRFVLRKPVN